jgi:lipoprotein-anchoring transpeptidase ErfK/SrfK
LRSNHKRIVSWPPALLISCFAFQLLVLPSSTDAWQRTTKKAHGRSTAPTVDADVLATQVMLDRAGYSPGEIDGRRGVSTERALAAYTKAGGNPASRSAEAVTTYTITEQDAAGPFTSPIPSDMMAKAALPSLGYSSVVEMLGERFHASPLLLERLNPDASFRAGETIRVPDVESGVAAAGAPPGKSVDPNSQALAIVTVRKSSSDLTVTDNTGRVLMYAPVTTGSERDPLPIGEWKVTGVQRDPPFRYNPSLFWDAEPSHSKATVPPGPNNPVGVVWVDITRPHYGLHGTPEPSTIGKTESHGCVRLTNWDASRLATLVRPGTRVVFAE